MILDIWRGLNGGPYMHSIHFSFSLGAFLSPIIAAPFLSKNEETASSLGNGTDSTSLVKEDAGDESRIWIYFLCAGSATVLVSFGYLFFAVSEARTRKRASLVVVGEGGIDGQVKTKTRWSFNMVAFVSIVCVFFFAYVGVEYLFGVYLTAFTVASKLSATKVQVGQLRHR